ncbi:MAG: DUF3095 family protein [Ferruginibacter sp.]
MEKSSNHLFYSRLPVNEIPLGELFTEEHLFYNIPSGWQVVITDIKNSTQAVANGVHETINLIATGSIVAILNIAYRENITVPFFFGGDGASFIIPELILDKAMAALHVHKENTQKNFKLDLRIGHVPVAEIYEQGYTLNIAKFKTSGLFIMPVLLGNGLLYAEKKIKGAGYTPGLFPASASLDLSGMQCRWDRIPPPGNFPEVISLLVTARDDANQPTVFKKVMDALDAVYGSPQVRRPISVEKLRLKTALGKIKMEVKTRMGAFRLLSAVNTWLRTTAGYFYFKTAKGKVYLHNLVDMSDTLVIDGRINTVISGTPEQRKLLEDILERLENNGDIYYGLCVSKESVMSCYVRNLNDKHVHFVDGAEGGYTRAAGMLKQKLHINQG